MHSAHLASLAIVALLTACKTGTIELEGDDGGSGDDTGTAAEDGGSGSDGGGDGGGTDGGGTDGGSPDGGGTDGGSPDGGGTDGGGTDGGGTDGGGDGGGSADWSGIYIGPLSITVGSDWGDYDLGDCETTLTVDTEGSLAGAAACSTGSWGGDTYEVPITGEVSDAGDVDAESSIDLGWSGTALVDITGEIDGDGTMWLEVSGKVGSDWSAAKLTGEGELQRQ